jgi:Tripartite tricarboxylate transporter TctB family
VKHLPAVGLAIFTAIFLAAAYMYPPQARAFPVAVAWVTLVLVAMDTTMDITKSRLNPAVASEALRSLGGPFVAVAWLAAFALMLVLIGILYTVPLYVIASLRFRGGRPWFTCLWIAALVTGGIWLLFAVVLRLDLYPGYFFPSR